VQSELKAIGTATDTHLPDIEYVLWAIVIGLVIVNTTGVAGGVGARARFVWAKFPKFVLGYIAISAPATWGTFSKADITSLGNLSKWAFLPTFAGVGLNTDIRAFAKSGFRPLAVGALSLAVVAVTSLLLVLGANSVFDLE
jgi:uncharacterized membrane protein YadS